MKRCFDSSSTKDRERIVKELSVHKEELLSSREGKLLFREFEVDLFIRNPTEWMQWVVRQKKASSLITELDAMTNISSVRKQSQIITPSLKSNDIKELPLKEDTKNSIDSSSMAANSNARKRKRKRNPSSNNDLAAKKDDDGALVNLERVKLLKSGTKMSGNTLISQIKEIVSR